MSDMLSSFLSSLTLSTGAIFTVYAMLDGALRKLYLYYKMVWNNTVNSCETLVRRKNDAQ